MKKSMPTEISEKYRLPKKLTDFQLSLYIHLIEWKWEYLTTEPGIHGGNKYDAILPKDFQDDLHPLYRPLVQEIRQNHPFKVHKHFGHMASSQAACINLFAPVLLNKEVADSVFPTINPKFSTLANDMLDGGFRFEYWDTSNPLNDHTDAAGTDSDVAIAYYDTNGELSLWLIEHKLTEDEFTTCGGYKSRGNHTKEQCRNGAQILNDRRRCFYHYHCDYRYWDITHSSELYDLNVLKTRIRCPFIGGENQLWRNQLMAHAIEEKQKFKNVHFSVVHHPKNNDLKKTIDSYTDMLENKDLFSVFTSERIINAVTQLNNKEIQKWANWYSELYNLSLIPSVNL
ncbi:MAG: hypothetical protein U9N83_20440 [Thermodesulfobacteriota bacterium]|nr:hypothetical protein [Thermodesulfobacteriota bacterium]